ncbi:MAG: GIY-YIG nuclease family protein [Limnochordia bacterium]|nr:GIY-YIG nuclease family protein [Limnochordia bacterium]MDD2630557.1 GIY-YIG nuclease family protein [Limnochordia bacterium]MDD4518918.1 GIY-YIG nuclease family protein [Limnochordia bacterium]
MSIFDLLGKIGNAVFEQAQKHHAQQLRQYSKSASEGKTHRIGGKTLGEWESSWQPIGILAIASLSKYASFVGLYRARLNGKIVYVGRAVEHSNGGFRKRLSDYRRSSDSARRHKSGQLMNQHADQLYIEILVTGSDAEAARVAVKLEPYFIGLHSPKWNKMLK